MCSDGVNVDSREKLSPFAGCDTLRFGLYGMDISERREMSDSGERIECPSIIPNIIFVEGRGDMRGVILFKEN